MNRLALTLMTCSLASVAQGSNLRARASTYNDNRELTRDRLAVDGDVGLTHTDGALSSTDWALSLTRDTYNDRHVDPKNKYIMENYGGGHRTEDAGTVSLGQTWSKLTDTRQMASIRRDEATRSSSYGLGASRWLFSESVQFSLDVSRTISNRPAWEYLDVDTELVEPLTRVTSTGTNVGIRHIMSPTTVVQYGYSNVISADRPPSRAGSVFLKQFIPEANGAVHVNVSRAINRGKLTTATTYGQVDAWQAEGAWLQSLAGGGTRARVSYRWYREDEETRAFGDLLTFGSDTFAFNLAQDIGKVTNGMPMMTAEAAATRYLANNGVNAVIWELGASTRF